MDRANTYNGQPLLSCFLSFRAVRVWVNMSRERALEEGADVVFLFYAVGRRRLSCVCSQVREGGISSRYRSEGGVVARRRREEGGDEECGRERERVMGMKRWKEERKVGG